MKRTTLTYKLARLLNRPLFPPEMLILSLTTRCNFNCKYCSIRSNNKTNGLKTDEIYDLLNQAGDMGIKTLVLSGGEPFVRQDIFDIISYADKIGLEVNIGSNGFLSKIMVQKIANSKINHLHFSVDGLEKTNDKLRRTGSFNIIIRNIRLLKNINPDLSLGIGTVVTSKNCNELFEMTLLADKLKVNNMNFIPYLTDNRNPKENKKSWKFWPNGGDIKNLEANLRKISSHKYSTVTIDKVPSFQQIISYYKKEKIDNECYSGYKSIIITCPESKNAKPQVFFCQGECGNPLEEGLKKAWLSGKARNTRREAKKCKNICLQLCHFIR